MGQYPHSPLDSADFKKNVFKRLSRIFHGLWWGEADRALRKPTTIRLSEMYEVHRRPSTAETSELTAVRGSNPGSSLVLYTVTLTALCRHIAELF